MFCSTCLVYYNVQKYVTDTSTHLSFNHDAKELKWILKIIKQKQIDSAMIENENDENTNRTKIKQRI